MLLGEFDFSIDLKHHFCQMIQLLETESDFLSGKKSFANHPKRNGFPMKQVIFGVQKIGFKCMPDGMSKIEDFTKTRFFGIRLDNSFF